MVLLVPFTVTPGARLGGITGLKEAMDEGGSATAEVVMVGGCYVGIGRVNCG